MTNQQTVPVPFPIGGWHWHSDAKNGLIKVPVKVRKNEWTRRSNNVQAKPVAGQRGAVPRLMPGCMKLCSLGGSPLEAILI
jgi:hypothetical protein